MTDPIKRPRLSNQTRELLEPGEKFPMKFLIMGVILVLVIAVILDFSGIGREKLSQTPDVKSDLQNIALNLDGGRYTDVDNLFSINVPPHWRIQTPPASEPYDVILSGPNQTDISIIASRVDFNSLPKLLEDIDRRERDSGLATNKDPFFFRGIPAVRRVAKLHYSKILAVDFVKDHVAHHILFGAPPEYFDQYEPAFIELMNTYEPVDNVIEPKDGSE